VFNLIMADPPWRFKVRSRKTGLKKSADIHYPTMTLADIMAMPVQAIAADDCILWLWCTWPMLQQGHEVMKAWGFDYRTGGAWHKLTANGKTAFGTGYIHRSASEPWLIGVRGRPKTTRVVRNIIAEARREHSRKPDDAFTKAEQLMPMARRIELFARQRRPGWDSWGKEVNRFPSAVAL
jgi:N6-adenosine-specific RNA methylase IME4